MRASFSRVSRLGPARLGAVVFAAVLAAGLLPATVAGFVASASHPGDFVSSDQVIVRWADGSPGTAFGAPATEVSAGARPARVAAVGTAAGVGASWVRTLAVGGDLYRLDATLAPGAMVSAVARLRATPGVASVEPDAIARAVASAPADPCWYGSSPCADGIGQWDLYEGTTASTYGIDLLGAWDRTRGAGVTVAVLDTGITSHPEFTGQTVPGYDFISTASVANDGGGRDSDPSDPGDSINPSNPSSWHGTHVTGTIAAIAGNGVGMSGIAPLAKIEPVRVLGVGGGYFSDISDAMVWASGGSVSGVPANPYPARVESLSLGGTTPCPGAMQSAVTSAISRGTVVVVAAGNGNTDASASAPANCSGVIAVGATTRDGARASFSNYGSTVAISAPGVSLWSTLNTGLTSPGSPTYAQYSGTSMSTPHVAAVAALMLAVKPSLTPAQVRSILQSTAHPLAPAGCSPGCGAGIVDAAKAVAAASGASSTPTPTPTSPVPTPTPTSTAGRPTPTPTAGRPTPTPTATAPTTCVSGTPTVIASPTSTYVVRGSTASIALTLRNADAPACPASTFTWTVTASRVVDGLYPSTPASVTVAAGSTVTVTASVTALFSATSLSGTTLTYRATRSASPTTASASVSIVVY